MSAYPIETTPLGAATWTSASPAPTSSPVNVRRGCAPGPARSGARVRTRGDHDGRRSFTGELLDAGDDGVTVAADTGVVSIPYADIHRSNLLGD